MTYFNLLMNMLRFGADTDELVNCIRACQEEIAAMADGVSTVALHGRKASVEAPDSLVSIVAALGAAAMRDHLPEVMLACTAYLRHDPDLLNALHKQEPQVTICEDVDAECPIPTVEPAPRRKYSKKSEKA